MPNQMLYTFFIWENNKWTFVESEVANHSEACDLFDSLKTKNTTILYAGEIKDCIGQKIGACYLEKDIPHLRKFFRASSLKNKNPRE